ncbi:MAG: hypothetical protein IJ341_02725 [Bacteroidales bacterium]|nr:hypothetical protein [Bacteroidales bacterium]
MTETWHNYGYGICVNDLEIDSVEKIEELLSHAPKYREEIHEYFNECEITEPTVDDYEEFDDDLCNGFATILKEVIYEATGINLDSESDYSSIRYLIYSPRYPWNMTYEDSAVTKEKLNEIFNKYVSIITDSNIEIDYQSIENCG